MKNITVLLLLACGLLAGYLLGDYRGKSAREALQKTIETEKTLDSERETAITRLKTELKNLNEKHHLELEAISKDNAARVAAWRRNKNGLSDIIKRSSRQLGESDTRMRSLISQREAATGTDRAGLDQEIARLHKAQVDLHSEIEGSSCLQVTVPHSVYEALNESNANGNK